MPHSFATLACVAALPELPHIHASSFFCLNKLEAFWQGLKANDPRLWGWKGKRIPLWIHGDGVEFSTDSLVTFTRGPSLFAPQDLRESQASKTTASTTWNDVHDVIAWSFTALWHGVRPGKDWAGRPLPQKLQGLAGKPITTESHQFACSIF